MFRLEQDGGRTCATEAARARQGPRRLRLRSRRLQHHPPAQAPGPESSAAEGPTVSGGVESGSSMTTVRRPVLSRNQQPPKKSTPNPPLAETQPVFQHPARAFGDSVESPKALCFL